MALYKLIRDWGGFEKGQVIEVVSQDRLIAMNGDEVNPPAGTLYTEIKVEFKSIPEPKIESKVLKQGEKKQQVKKGSKK